MEFFIDQSSKKPTAKVAVRLELLITADMFIFAIAESITNKVNRIETKADLQKVVEEFITEYGFEALQQQDADLIYVPHLKTGKERLLNIAPELFNQ